MDPYKWSDLFGSIQEGMIRSDALGSLSGHCHPDFYSRSRPCPLSRVTRSSSETLTSFGIQRPESEH